MDIATSDFQPRQLRPVPQRLGLFLRASRFDQAPLLDLLARRDATFTGVVIDATAIKTQRELRERAATARLDVILDPRTQQSATVGGHGSRLASLPWGAERPHAYEDFKGRAGRNAVAAIAASVVEHGFSEVIAPTHLLRDSEDPWLPIDVENSELLRSELDRQGGQRVPIVYSVAIPYAAFRDSTQREAIVDRLRDGPAGALWLRVDGLGAASTASALRCYLEGASDFAQLGLPVIADGMGGLVGLSLLAFGAAGGLAHGITFGERFDAGSWRQKRNQQGGGQKRRIYVPDLDMMLSAEEAESFLRHSMRAKSLFACRDTHCCPRGLSDMLENPARHFLMQRMQQISTLSGIHTPLRASEFLERLVRPASDRLVDAARLQLPDEAFKAKLRKQRKHVDAIRVMLGTEARNRAGARSSPVPLHRAAREGRANP